MPAATPTDDSRRRRRRRRRTKAPRPALEHFPARAFLENRSVGRSVLQCARATAHAPLNDKRQTLRREVVHILCRARANGDDGSNSRIPLSESFPARGCGRGEGACRRNFTAGARCSLRAGLRSISIDGRSRESLDLRRARSPFRSALNKPLPVSQHRLFRSRSPISLFFFAIVLA